MSKDKRKKVEKNVINLIAEENKFGIKKFETYKKFGEKIYKTRENVLRKLSELKAKNNLIIGYGAPAKATTLINFFNISTNILSFLPEGLSSELLKNLDSTPILRDILVIRLIFKSDKYLGFC